MQQTQISSHAINYITHNILEMLTFCYDGCFSGVEVVVLLCWWDVG